MENKLNNQVCPTCQSSTNSFVAGAAIGAVLGAVLGLMLSPASGEQNRRNLVKAAGNTKKYVEDKVDDLEEAYEDVREDAEEFIHQVEKKAAPLKRQASRYAVSTLNAVEDSAKDAKKKFFRGVRI
jgi:gas vesicle protein